MKEGASELNENILNPDYSSFRLKRDEYRDKRGGQSELFDINCGKCGNLTLVYQKDGYPRQKLYRCYLNRILWPPALALLESTVSTKKEMPELKCDICETKLGTPMVYKDGRLAYGLILGNFTKSKVKK